MKTFLEVIKDYLKTASIEERKEVLNLIKGQELDIDPLKVESYIKSQVEEYVRVGNKLRAVKLVKDVTGMGLKEAKDWVDSNFDWPKTY